MATHNTKRELLSHLDKLTRELTDFNIGDFTTAKIAQSALMSRSLASQYLNELVREQEVVKINARPVLFFHRRGFER